MEIGKFNSCVVHVVYDPLSPFILTNGFIDHPRNVIEGVRQGEWMIIPLYNVTRISSFEIPD